MHKLIYPLAVVALITAACGGSDTTDTTAATTATTATTAAPTTTTTLPTTAPTSTTTTSTTTTSTTTTTTTTTTLPPHPGIESEIVLGSRPCALEVDAAGNAWVTMLGSRQLLLISPDGEQLDEVSAGNGACGVAIAGGFIWVADTSSDSVFRLNGETLEFVDRISLEGPPWDLQTIGDLVWIVQRQPGRVLAVTPDTAEIVIDVAPGLGQMAGMALTEDAAWAAVEFGDVVVRIDATTGDVTEIPIAGSPSWFGESAGAVWVSQATSGQVSKIDTATSEVVLTVDVGAQPLDLTVGFGSVWVPNRTDGTVTRIDEATGEVVDTYGLKDGVWVAEAVGDKVWILDFSGNTIFVIDPTVAR